jgi:hypothetical protein
MLGNYKIRVNNEAESKEAKELFEQLGFEKTGFSCDENPYYLATWEGGFSDYPLDSLNVSRARKEITLTQLRDLVAQSKKEQGLISGADALRALADGKDVEYFTDKWVGCDSKQLVVSWYLDDVYQFRIKPTTVKIEIEIPKPFEPKVGDEIFVLCPYYGCGYRHEYYQEDQKPCIQFGAWRTEKEVKQVVAALRSALTSK